MFVCLEEGYCEYIGFMLCYASDNIDYDRRHKMPTV